MYLQLEQFLIRTFQEGDEKSVAFYANNRNIWRNLRDVFPFPYTIDHAITFLSQVRAERWPNTFAIDVDGEAAGAISLLPKQDVFHRTAELGYWLAEPFWNRGIMTQAVQAITEWGFRAQDFYRIEAHVFEWNTASMRVLEKAGYTQESRLKKSVTKDGQTIDSYLYAILSDELNTEMVPGASE